MSDDSTYTTRKLVRQEWKPLGGRRIVRFVAMPGSVSIPGQSWRDDLPGNSEIINEMLGYAEFESHTDFPAMETMEEFIEEVEEHGSNVAWFDPLDGDGTVGETIEPESSGIDRTDGGSDSAPAVGGADTPEILDGNAGPADVEERVYRGMVSGIKEYGIFVTLQPDIAPYNDVSGLVHKTRLNLHKPDEFMLGDVVDVEVIDVEYEDRDTMKIELNLVATPEDPEVPWGESHV